MYFRILFVSFLAVFIQHAVRVIWMFGFHHAPAYNHAPGPCHSLSEIEHGSVDIEVLPDGTAFISSGLLPDMAPRGRIYIYNVSEPETKARELGFSQDYDAKNFWPHGLGLWTDPETGEVTLFVVNHNPSGGRIEKFHFQREPELLVHLDTIIDSSMRVMNDIIPIDDKRFFFTNFFHSHDLMLAEWLLMLSWGTIVFYNGSQGRVVHRAFVPSGIALSPDKQYVYVAVFHEGIRTYRRSSVGAHESLEFVETMPIYHGVNSIHVDMESGDVWTGVANSVQELFMHDMDHFSMCGSRVMHFQAKHGHLSEVREVYASDGRETSCAATGTYHRGHLLIGSIMDSPTHCIVKEF